MNKIENMNEDEILKLTEFDILKMINLEKAEKGLKILNKPIKPEYIEIKDKNTTVYGCSVLGNLYFEDVNELKKVINLLSDSKTIGHIKPSESNYYFSKGIKTIFSSNKWYEIITKTIYSEKLFTKIEDNIKQNSLLKSNYNVKLSDYNEYLESCKPIEDKIRKQYNQVNNKYIKLNEYNRLMIEDYMPLSDNNEKIAISFLTKAYSLNDYEHNYVLNNYKNYNNETK